MKHLNSTLTASMLFVGILTLFPIGGVFASGGDDYVEDELVCRLMDGYDINGINSLYGTTLVTTLGYIGSYLMKTPGGQDAESLAAVISLEPGVIYCDANYIMSSPNPVQTSQPFVDGGGGGGSAFTSQVAATTLSLASVQTVVTGSGVTVGVVDVGVDVTHPALAGQAVSGYDFVSADSSAIDEVGGSASGHGTFVAGIIKLVAPQATIRAYRVLDTAGHGDGFSVAAAILRAIQDGCKVINLSIIMGGVHGAVDDALDSAVAHNITVVAAAGNDSVEVLRYPARDPHTLAVGAVDSLDHKTDFSNYGNDLVVCAPGLRVYSSYLNSSYAWWDGTSFATPFVSGQVALLYSIRPQATCDEIRGFVQSSAENIDSLNPTLPGLLGTGRINVASSIDEATALTCGDLDGTGNISIGDAVFLLSYIFLGGPSPSNALVADVDNSSAVNIGDAVSLLGFIFFDGTAPNCGP